MKEQVDLEKKHPVVLIVDDDATVRILQRRALDFFILHTSP